MAITLQDILAALGGTLNGVTQAILAITFGFAMLPSALAYAVGIIGCLVFNSTIPISFQAETIALAGNMGKTSRERYSMIIFAGLAMAVIGAFGLIENIVQFAGENIIAAMMAGVGIILVKLSIDIMNENRKIGVISMAIAIITYAFTSSLVYTFVACIILSSLATYFLKFDISIDNVTEDAFIFQKPIFNFSVLRGTFALICLTIGGNIAFGGISAGISRVDANIDHVTIYSGLADVVSAIFGGSPISVVIAPTAAAPNPKMASIILMVFMMTILLTKSLSKIAKFIPTSAVTGTLFILGAIITIPPNLLDAFSNATAAGALASSVTLAVTAVTDPFLGLLAGIIVNVIAIPLGLA